VKITTIKELESLEGIIGIENIAAGKKLLAEGGIMWVFQDPKAIEADSDLYKEEKADCLVRFDRDKLGWVGYFRPKPRIIPGFLPHTNLDTHGNSYPKNGMQTKWSH
jgi:hypothetical protein